MFPPASLPGALPHSLSLCSPGLPSDDEGCFSSRPHHRHPFEGILPILSHRYAPWLRVLTATGSVVLLALSAHGGDPPRGPRPRGVVPPATLDVGFDPLVCVPGLASVVFLVTWAKLVSRSCFFEPRRIRFLTPLWSIRLPLRYLPPCPPWWVPCLWFGWK